MRKSNLWRLLALILALVMVLGCFAGCSDDAISSDREEEEEDDPRDGLKKHTFNGLTFYLDKSFEKDEDNSDEFTDCWSDDDIVASVTTTCNFEDWTAKEFRDAFEESYSANHEVDTGKKNGIYYLTVDYGYAPGDQLDSEDCTTVIGFYAKGNTLGMIFVASEDFDEFEDDMIDYATLGKLKDFYEDEDEDDEDGDELPGTQEVQNITLTVWAPQEDQVEGNAWLLAMEEAFEELHPEYRITWVNEACSEGDAGGMVTQDVSAAADVYFFASDQLGTLINAGALTRLGGIYETQIQNDNSQLVIDTVTHTDGSIYGFPVANNTWFMYYNKDVYTEEDVKSLETMLEKGTVAFPWCVGWYNGAFFLGNGGTIFGTNGNDESAGIQFGRQAGYDAAASMITLATHPNMINDYSDLGVAGLKDGTIDAFFSGSWMAAGLKDALGDSLGVTQLPTFQCGGQSRQMMALASTKCVGVNLYAQNQLVATEFAAFLASTEGQLLRYEMRGVIPAAKELADHPTVTADPVAVAEINTMTNAAAIQSSLPGMNYYWTPMGTFGSSILNGETSMDNYKDQVDLLMQQLNAGGI